MSKFTVHNPEAIFAAALCASTEHIRYYLNGVLLDWSGETMLAVATDGHRLAKINVSVDAAPDKLTQYPVLSSSCVERIKKAAKGQKRAEGVNDAGFYSVAIDLEAKTVQTNGATFPLELIDGTYPDWQRVMVADDGETTVFGVNASYLADMDKMARLLNGSRFWKLAHSSTNAPSLWQYRSNSARADYLIMPVRV